MLLLVWVRLNFLVEKTTIPATELSCGFLASREVRAV
jgi:hypothetical protein